MANETITRKLDKTGLSHVWAKILENFIAKGDADLNVIESVSVNGVALEVTDKGVNITVPTGALAELDKVDADHMADAVLDLINAKAGKATTLEGYGITDAYTKEETATQIEDAVKQALTGVYTVKGSIAFADLPATEDVKDGWVYNIKEEFETTEAFIEGAGHTYPAGTNVVYTADGWDVMAGTYDFSEFLKASDLEDITEEEIDEICVMPE